MPELSRVRSGRFRQRDELIQPESVSQPRSLLLGSARGVPYSYPNDRALHTDRRGCATLAERHACARAADQARVEVPHVSAAVPGAGVAALHPKLAVPLRRRQSKSNM
jgi:hypothetical protein